MTTTLTSDTLTSIARLHQSFSLAERQEAAATSINERQEGERVDTAYLRVLERTARINELEATFTTADLVAADENAGDYEWQGDEPFDAAYLRTLERWNASRDSF